MDSPAADPAELRASLLFIRRINAWLGYTRATLFHLSRFCRNWKPGETITIVDFATGSADVPIAVAKWGAERGHRLTLLGLDLHPATAAVAAREAAAVADRASDTQSRSGGQIKIQIAQADALRSPLADGGVDYALCSMFLHHLSEEQGVGLLKEMDRVSRRGLLLADLLRSRRAYAWIRLFTLFSSPMVRHDARASVAQAFTRAEIVQLRDRAGLAYLNYVPHFGHRFALVGEKSATE
jgi:ubiquinone/menaquinone biosynthesis C-methylase UbiE